MAGLIRGWAVVYRETEFWVSEGVLDDCLAMEGLRRTSPDVGVYQIVNGEWLPAVTTEPRPEGVP